MRHGIFSAFDPAAMVVDPTDPTVIARLKPGAMIMVREMPTALFTMPGGSLGEVVASELAEAESWR